MREWAVATAPANMPVRVAFSAQGAARRNRNRRLGAIICSRACRWNVAHKQRVCASGNLSRLSAVRNRRTPAGRCRAHSRQSPPRPIAGALRAGPAYCAKGSRRLSRILHSVALGTVLTYQNPAAYLRRTAEIMLSKVVAGRPISRESVALLSNNAP